MGTFIAPPLLDATLSARGKAEKAAEQRSNQGNPRRALEEGRAFS
jgi:hypothetical protein